MVDYLVDLIIVSILLFFAITGYISGLSGKILSILTWAGSGAIAYFLYPHLSPLLTSYISSDLIRDGASFAGLFILFLILFSFFSSQVSGTIKKSKAGTADRNLGLVLGLIIGSVFLVLAASTLRFFVDTEHHKPEALQKSNLFPYVQTCLNKVCQLFPGVSYLTLKKDHTSEMPKNNQDVKILSGFAPSKAPSSSENPLESGYGSKERSELTSLLKKIH